MPATTVLVLGASGMLGNAVLRLFASSPGYTVVGTVRSVNAQRALPADQRGLVRVGIDVENLDSLTQVFASVRPNVVINCVGVVKQLADANDPLVALPINALLPHRLSRLCQMMDARLIHVSTDCVFSGRAGNYREDHPSDAYDLYGRSKYLGEVDQPHAVTLRTSIIGHELGSAHGLVGWFLAQQGSTKGYTRAIFSGFPTVELAKIMRDVVLPRVELRGLYHVSSAAINKFDLLTLVAQVYGKSIGITPDDRVVIDRSLDSTRFREATGYAPPSWPDLIRDMHRFG
jgi:dTDP-4-dehydrorhamnose reductase